MSCLKRLQRFLAGLIVVTFFVTNTLTPSPIAHAASVESPSLISSFKVPAEFGKVTDISLGTRDSHLGPNTDQSERSGDWGRPNYRSEKEMESLDGTHTTRNPNESRVVIHIQEAHANYDAQKNIKKILEHLSQNYGIELVLLEGAGYKIDPAIFSFFPKDRDFQNAANEKLMQAGELTGAEVFLIDQESATRNGQRATEGKKALSVERSTLSAPEAYGVENAKEYREGREAYRTVFDSRKRTTSFLEAFYLQWQKQADLRLNKKLRVFLNRYISFEEEKLPLEGWFETLKDVAARHLTFSPLSKRGARGDLASGKIPLNPPLLKGEVSEERLDLEDVRAQIDWPVLVRYFRLKKIGPQIDPAKVEKEKKEFLKDIQKFVSRGSRLATQKTRSQNESLTSSGESLFQEVEQIFEASKKNDLPLYKTRFVFERLMDALPVDFSFEAYPTLRLYIQQMILLSEIQREVLQNEMGALFLKILGTLVETEEEQRLVDILQNYGLLKKLFKLELSRKEFGELRAAAVTPEKITSGLGLKSSKLESITSIFEAAIRFYEIAIKREKIMTENTLRRMRESKKTKAVLITGGFHTDGFKQAIASSGNSYIGITPNIGEIAADSRKNYLTAFLGSGAVSRSQQAPIVRSELRFLQEVLPQEWRREWAGTGKRVAGIVGQVSAGGARAVRRNFAAAVSRIFPPPGLVLAGASAPGVRPRSLEEIPVVTGGGRSESRASGDMERVLVPALRELLDVLHRSREQITKENIAEVRAKVEALESQFTRFFSSRGGSPEFSVLHAIVEHIERLSEIWEERRGERDLKVIVNFDPVFRLLTQEMSDDGVTLPNEANVLLSQLGLGAGMIDFGVAGGNEVQMISTFHEADLRKGFVRNVTRWGTDLARGGIVVFLSPKIARLVRAELVSWKPVVEGASVAPEIAFDQILFQILARFQTRDGLGYTKAEGTTLNIVTPVKASPSQVRWNLEYKLSPVAAGVKGLKRSQIVRNIASIIFLPSSREGQVRSEARTEPTARQSAILKRFGISWEPETGRIVYAENFKPLQLKSKILFVRHGETELMELSRQDGHRRYQGATDEEINRLSSDGRKQAGAAVFLLEPLLGEAKPPVFFTSPLTRARETAQPFETYFGIRARIRPGLQEMSYGKFENFTNDEIRARFGEQALQESLSYRVDDNPFVRVGGGESFAELLERAAEEILEIDKILDGKTGVIFGHATLGAALRVLLEAPSQGVIRWREKFPEAAAPFVLYDPVGRGRSEVREVAMNFIHAFMPMFVAVNAFGVLPAVLSLTGDMKTLERLKVFRNSVITATVVAAIFFVFGEAILKTLGIDIPTFRIAGGLVLLLISLKRILAVGDDRAIITEDVAAVPIGVPFIVGPAVITTILTLKAQYGIGIMAPVILSNIMIAGTVFFFGSIFQKYLGKSGIRTISKVASLLLAATATGMIVKGVKSEFFTQSDPLPVREISVSDAAAPFFSFKQSGVRSEGRGVPDILAWQVNARKIGVSVRGETFFAGSADELYQQLTRHGIEAIREGKGNIVVGDESMHWNDTAALENALRGLSRSESRFSRHFSRESIGDARGKISDFLQAQGVTEEALHGTFVSVRPRDRKITYQITVGAHKEVLGFVTVDDLSRQAGIPDIESVEWIEIAPETSRANMRDALAVQEAAAVPEKLKARAEVRAIPDEIMRDFRAAAPGTEAFENAKRTILEIGEEALPGLFAPAWSEDVLKFQEVLWEIQKTSKPNRFQRHLLDFLVSGAPLSKDQRKFVFEEQFLGANLKRELLEHLLRALGTPERLSPKERGVIDQNQQLLELVALCLNEYRPFFKGDLRRILFEYAFNQKGTHFFLENVAAVRALEALGEEGLDAMLPFVIQFGKVKFDTMESFKFVKETIADLMKRHQVFFQGKLFIELFGNKYTGEEVAEALDAMDRFRPAALAEVWPQTYRKVLTGLELFLGGNYPSYGEWVQSPFWVAALQGDQALEAFWDDFQQTIYTTLRREAEEVDLIVQKRFAQLVSIWGFKRVMRWVLLWSELATKRITVDPRIFDNLLDEESRRGDGKGNLEKVMEKTMSSRDLGLLQETVSYFINTEDQIGPFLTHVLAFMVRFPSETAFLIPLFVSRLRMGASSFQERYGAQHYLARLLNLQQRPTLFLTRKLVESVPYPRGLSQVTLLRKYSGDLDDLYGRKGFLRDLRYRIHRAPSSQNKEIMEALFDCIAAESLDPLLRFIPEKFAASLKQESEEAYPGLLGTWNRMLRKVLDDQKKTDRSIGDVKNFSEEDFLQILNALKGEDRDVLGLRLFLETYKELCQRYTTVDQLPGNDMNAVRRNLEEKKFLAAIGEIFQMIRKAAPEMTIEEPEDNSSTERTYALDHSISEEERWGFEPHSVVLFTKERALLAFERIAKLRRWFVSAYEGYNAKIQEEHFKLNDQGENVLRKETLEKISDDYLKQLARGVRYLLDFLYDLSFPCHDLEELRDLLLHETLSLAQFRDVLKEIEIRLGRIEVIIQLWFGGYAQSAATMLGEEKIRVFLGGKEPVEGTDLFSYAENKLVTDIYDEEGFTAFRAYLRLNLQMMEGLLKTDRKLQLNSNQKDPFVGIVPFYSGVKINKPLLASSLGNKGVMLAEMSRHGHPVPPGFILSTRYLNSAVRKPKKFRAAVLQEILDLEKRTGRRFPFRLEKLDPKETELVVRTRGDKEELKGDLLLVSVRSGSFVSLPGVLDTILDLPATQRVMEYWIAQGMSPHIAYDIRRRYLTSYATATLGFQEAYFSQIINSLKGTKGDEIRTTIHQFTDEEMLQVLRRIETDINDALVILNQLANMELNEKNWRKKFFYYLNLLRGQGGMEAKIHTTTFFEMDYETLERTDDAVLKANVLNLQKKIKAFPKFAYDDDEFEILLSAIREIAQSWDSPRARRYRQDRNMSHEWGTPATVQAMVFGNLSSSSGAFVAQTHNLVTGVPMVDGDFKQQGQGEDLVAGRTKHADRIRQSPIKPSLEQKKPELFRRLVTFLEEQSRFGGGPRQIEGIVENGKIYSLQNVGMDLVGKKPGLLPKENERPFIIGEGGSPGRQGARQVRLLFDQSKLTDLKRSLMNLREEMNAAGQGKLGIALVAGYLTAEEAEKAARWEELDALIVSAVGGSAHATVAARKAGKILVSSIPHLNYHPAYGWRYKGNELKDGMEGNVYSIDGNITGPTAGFIYQGEIEIEGETKARETKGDPQEGQNFLGALFSRRASKTVGLARSEARSEGGAIWPFQSIMHIAWEMAPFKKAGGLADVIGELPLAMKRKYPGKDISVTIPYHKDLDLQGLTPVSVRRFGYDSPDGYQAWESFKVEYQGVNVFLLQRLSMGAEKEAPLFIHGYKTDNFYEGANFSKAAVEFMAQAGMRPDIVHPHDQMASYIPAIIRDTRDGFFRESVVVYTAHHFAPGYQGREDLDRGRRYLTGLGLSAGLFAVGGALNMAGQLNPLQGASRLADFISTVSGVFAWEAATSELSKGLQGLLAHRFFQSQTFVGVTNAIDKQMWSPETGAGIRHPFTQSTIINGKQANKAFLQTSYGLKKDPSAPLLAFISRYDAHVKGFDIVPQVVGELMSHFRDLQVVFAGDGEEGVKSALQKLREYYPDRVYVSPGFVKADTVRSILAAADFVGMPSRIEPAGLVQQQGHMLGAIPIVTRVGGLEETVHDPIFVQDTGAQTGFKSNLTDQLAITFAMSVVRALGAYYRDRDRGTQELLRIRLDGRDSVSSWDDRVDEYFTLYQKALKNRKIFIGGRSEIRSWQEENVPELEDYTVVSRQLEAGLSRDILQRLKAEFGEEIAGLVAATTVTGGLGALMHDLFPSWQKNFGAPEKKNIDALAINVIYDEIKGQAYAKDLPEVVTSGKKTLGDYLREVLTEDPKLRLRISLEAGDEFRTKADEWIGRTSDALYKKRLQQARDAVDREIRIKVYPTETSVGGMPNFYIEAFYIDEYGEKIQIFDEVYPDAPHGAPNLWRDLQMGVYRKVTELLTLKLQEQGVVKKKIFFVDNEVFVSLPTPLLPEALHHHMNHSVFAPTIYQPDEASLEVLGYSRALRPYIVRNGKISITDAAGMTFDLITGVALYEHTPAVTGGVMPGYADVVDSYNEDGLRSTNGVLLEQWQSPLLRGLIDSYKKKLGMDVAVDDRIFFAKLSESAQSSFLNEFKERTEVIKAFLTGRLMLWLKESQNRPSWFDQAMKSYQEEFELPEVYGDRLLVDLNHRIQKALGNENEWVALLADAKIQALKREFLKTPIVSNVRRQVNYKGPDKWKEVLLSLKADPARLEWYKKNAAWAVIGGREFGADAHGLFLEIQHLVRELGLEDKFATIENYNIEVAPVIFQGISGSVMLSYEILEASATSMMKGLPNGAALIGVWGGAEPELFTIIESATGREVNIFKEHVTYEELTEKLQTGAWKITNGFLVEYSASGDGKFVLNTIVDGKIQTVNARPPSADSLASALVQLQDRYLDPSARRELLWEALRSSPVVDMEKSQARAHMKLWQRIIVKSEKKKALLEKPGLSPESALKFLSQRAWGDAGFVWRNESSNPLEIAPPGPLAFIESARQLRTHGAEGYRSVAYHAAKGDIFARVFHYLSGYENEAPALYQEMSRLKAQADAATDLLEKVKANLAALRLFDRFVVALSGNVLQGYINSRSKEYEILLKNDLFRQNLYFYLETNGRRFGSMNKSLAGFAIQEGEEKYIVALNLGEPKYPGIDGGEPKAWGQFYGQREFEWLTGQADPESATMTYQVINAITGEAYGAGENRKPYPLWMLAQGTLPVGVPSPDIQILKLRATGEMKPEEKQEQLASLILDDLRALVSGDPREQLRQGKPRIYWLKKMIVYYQHGSPEELKTRLQAVSGIGKDKKDKRDSAIALFGAEGVRPVMAFIAALVPELLEDMKDWDAEVYAALKGVMQDPEVKDLFERGEVSFSDASSGTAVVISRTIKEESEGLEQKRHVVIPIHFAKTPYNKEEGKVWFGIGSIATLGLLPGMVYQARDLILGKVYEKKHTLSSLLKEGWRTGIPVVKRKDPAGIQQTGWRFQVLQMVPVGVTRSELRAGVVEVFAAANSVPVAVIASAAVVAIAGYLVLEKWLLPLSRRAGSARALANIFLDIEELKALRRVYEFPQFLKGSEDYQAAFSRLEMVLNMQGTAVRRDKYHRIKLDAVGGLGTLELAIKIKSKQFAAKVKALLEADKKQEVILGRLIDSGVAEEVSTANDFLAGKALAKDIFLGLWKGTIDLVRMDDLIRRAQQDPGLAVYVIGEVIRLRRDNDKRAGLGPQKWKEVDAEALRIRRAVSSRRDMSFASASTIQPPVAEFKAQKAARSEARLPLPAGRQAPDNSVAGELTKDQVRTANQKEWFFPEDLDTTLEGLAGVVRQAEANKEPIRLTAVSNSPEQDDLLEMLGFTAVKPRSVVEREFLEALPARLESDTTAQFLRKGNHLEIFFAAGEKADLMLQNGVYSRTFENLIGGQLQGVERQRGVQSFATEIQKRTVVLKAAALPAEFALNDKNTLGEWLGLDTFFLQNAVITQAEYEKLSVAKPAPTSAPESVATSAPKLARKEKHVPTLSVAQQHIRERLGNLSKEIVRLREGPGSAGSLRELAVDVDSLDQALKGLLTDAAEAKIRGASGEIEELVQQDPRLKGVRVTQQVIEKYLDRVSSFVAARKVTDRLEGKVMGRETLQKISAGLGQVEEKIGLLGRSPNVQTKNLGDLVYRIEILHKWISDYVAFLLGEERQISGFTVPENVLTRLWFLEGALGTLIRVAPLLLGFVERSQRTGEREFSYIGDRTEGLPLEKNMSEEQVLRSTRALEELKRLLDDAFSELGYARQEAYVPVVRKVLKDLSDEALVFSQKRPMSGAEVVTFGYRVLAWGKWLLGPEGHGYDEIFKGNNSLEEVPRLALELPMIFLKNGAPERSEMRSAAVAVPPLAVPIPATRAVHVADRMLPDDIRPTTYDLQTFIEENVRRGGGREGFGAVPEKLTDRIISMVPYTFDATVVQIVINALVPSAFANEPMTVASEVTPAQKAAFMKAVRALGMKTVEGYDAMILTKEFAFDRKALLAIQKVFSGTRIIVLANEKQLSPADLDFLAQLPQASRPILFPADHLDEARKLLGMEAVGRDLHLKAMAGANDSDAVMLKKQLGDDAILMTSKGLEMFLATAGVNALVSAMQAQYLATSRSA